MNKGSNWRAAFFYQRALLVLALISATGFAFATGKLFAFFRPDAGKNAFHRTLTFEDRVNYQRAIEEVYWRHRVWPKDRPDSKPSLDTVMPRAQLEKKVQGYLRDSQALADYWQQPITAEQLQAEMNRMAMRTKQPDTLRELFEALGKDPFVVAECLARPALTERGLTDRYAYDQRIHGHLRKRAESDLSAHAGVEEMKQTSGTYCEIDLLKSDSNERKPGHGIEYGFTLTNEEWDHTVEKLATNFNQPNGPNRAASRERKNVPVRQLSSLQEDQSRYYAMAVIEKTEKRIKLATVTWAKEPLEVWRAKVVQALTIASATPSTAYTLPIISGVAQECADSWATSAINLPTPRVSHSALWTGSEMIIWGGGVGDPFTPVNTGGRYDPATDTWTTTSTFNAPSPRGGHSAIWTGTEMIIWGGGWLNTGGRYNPTTDTWTETSATNVPDARSGHSCVWTGNEMIVWGGFGPIGNLDTGGRYNPFTDTWRATSMVNVPTARGWHCTVWTGTEMIVWGGYVYNFIDKTLNTGGRYNPATDTWTATSLTNAPIARLGPTAVWTGTQMIVWGGTSIGDPFNIGPFNTGAKYNPATNSWTATSMTNVPAARDAHTAVWTGADMIVWGGRTPAGFVNTGSKYRPNTNTWTAISDNNAPPSRWAHSAVWTGTEMIVFGGIGNLSSTGALNTVGRYKPTTDTWAPNQPPQGRIYHTMVWTGNEMILWGGTNGYFYENTGGRYNPATDSWSFTSTDSAPSPRAYHTAIWTGLEMIVWGGDVVTQNANTGGRYNPGTNSWTPTSITNAPVGRSFHTAVWTGSEMIVWGGSDNFGNRLDTGGKYNPIADLWTSITDTNAPAGRSLHTAVWTGQEMIVWGGTDSQSFGVNAAGLNSGGKYDPVGDSWLSTNVTDAPDGRYNHTAIWTGNEMIVWGGDVYTSSVVGTGARYDPVSDAWKPTSLTDVPLARGGHTAVWTGSEMIVWGGFGQSIFYLDSGGRYDPAADIWIPTSTDGNCPPGRNGHAAVWTGNEMIVWGGLNPFGYLNNGGRYCAKSNSSPTPTPTPTATPIPTATPQPTLPTAGLLVVPSTVSKGGTATFTISLSASASQDVTVNYSMTGNALLGMDYALSGPANQVVIPAGQTSGDVIVTVTTPKTKGKEKATMTLGTGSGYQLPTVGKRQRIKSPKATVTIKNK